MIRKSLRHLYHRYVVLPRIHRTYRDLSAQETFRAIYRSKAWGDDGTSFCSGWGSRGAAVEDYCNLVIGFIRDHGIQSVVDLGCGDFSVGRRIVDATEVEYVGIDIVPELIAHHEKSSQCARARFQCADITKDALPSADLCFVRQVFQHLSNREITDALAKLKAFPRVLICEDVPVRPKSFNRDKPHGPDVRALCGSGVYLDHPPFSVPIAKEWNFPLSATNHLRVVLVENDGGGTAQKELPKIKFADSGKK